MTTTHAVDECISVQKPDARDRLLELRTTIRAAVPTATELISYGIPTYKLGVHFAAARRHCALYGAAIDLASAEKLVLGKLCQ